MPAAEIPQRLGQAVEALETVPLLARAMERAELEAPVVSALSRLIDGTLPLDDWVRAGAGQAAAAGAVRPPQHLVAAAEGVVHAPPSGHRRLDSYER